jgi:hypothetical protein
MNLPEFLRSLEAVAECSEASRGRLKTMRENMARIAEVRATVKGGQENR